MRVVSLFSGAGGMDLGFLRAGHKIVWANDNDSEAVETYRANIGNHIVEEAIENIRTGEIPDGDIVIGGFPCQGFSVANMNRSETDGRNTLYLEMLRIIDGKRPDYFLAENVKGLLTLGGGRVFAGILRDFENIGYQVRHEVLNAADFGVPQVRLRVFIVGTREGSGGCFEFPAPTHTEHPILFGDRLPWVSIGGALAEIPEPVDAPHLPNHTFSKYKLRFNNYLGHRRIDPRKPAPTVTARGDRKGGVVVLHHPNNRRRMSARELALTQSFPVDYWFAGPRSSVYRQVGNAVPPLLAEALARQFGR